MVQKRSAGRRHTSAGAAKATATRAKKNDSDEAETQAFGFIPADPQDARLTLEGAKVLEDGKINITAYEDLMACYAGEPPPSDHPNPERPGVRTDEVVPKGLRIWDDLRAGAEDKDGAGWIASRCTKRDGKKEKWFNIRTCGSWRLAFVLARLQRGLWERGSFDNFEDDDQLGEDGFEKLAKVKRSPASAKSRGGSVAGAGAAESTGSMSASSSSSVAAPTTAGSDRPPSTPDTRASKPQAADKSSRKRDRPMSHKQEQEPTKPQRKKPRQQESPQTQTKVSFIGPEVVAGSVRLQQILEARRLAAEKQAASTPKNARRRVTGKSSVL